MEFIIQPNLTPSYVWGDNYFDYKKEVLEEEVAFQDQLIQVELNNKRTVTDIVESITLMDDYNSSAPIPVDDDVEATMKSFIETNSCSQSNNEWELTLSDEVVDLKNQFEKTIATDHDFFKKRKIPITEITTATENEGVGGEEQVHKKKKRKSEGAGYTIWTYLVDHYNSLHHSAKRGEAKAAEAKADEEVPPTPSSIAFDNLIVDDCGDGISILTEMRAASSDDEDDDDDFEKDDNDDDEDDENIHSVNKENRDPYKAARVSALEKLVGKFVLGLQLYQGEGEYGKVVKHTDGYIHVQWTEKDGTNYRKCALYNPLNEEDMKDLHSYPYAKAARVSALKELIGQFPIGLQLYQDVGDCGKVTKYTDGYIHVQFTDHKNGTVLLRSDMFDPLNTEDMKELRSYQRVKNRTEEFTTSNSFITTKAITEDEEQRGENNSNTDDSPASDAAATTNASAGNGIITTFNGVTTKAITEGEEDRGDNDNDTPALVMTAATSAIMGNSTIEACKCVKTKAITEVEECFSDNNNDNDSPASVTAAASNVIVRNRPITTSTDSSHSNSKDVTTTIITEGETCRSNNNNDDDSSAPVSATASNSVARNGQISTNTNDYHPHLASDENPIDAAERHRKWVTQTLLVNIWCNPNLSDIEKAIRTEKVKRCDEGYASLKDGTCTEKTASTIDNDGGKTGAGRRCCSRQQQASPIPLRQRPRYHGIKRIIARKR